MLVFGLVGFKSNQDNSINLTVDKLNVNLTEDNIRELVSWLTWHQQRSVYGSLNRTITRQDIAAGERVRNMLYDAPDPFPNQVGAEAQG